MYSLQAQSSKASILIFSILRAATFCKIHIPTTKPDMPPAHYTDTHRTLTGRNWLKLSLAGALAMLLGTHFSDLQATGTTVKAPASKARPPMATAMEPAPISLERPIAVAMAAPVAVAVPMRAEPVDPQVLGESLQEAVRSGNAAQIRFLVKQGAVLDTVDETNRTPLMLGVIFNRPASVKQLLALGANTALKDTEGLTALLHARKLGLPRIARLLDKR